MLEYNFSLFVFLGVVLFFIALCGIFLVRRNIIIMLIAIELMVLACSYCFAVFSIYMDDLIGQLFSVFLLSVAGSEAAIGLAILIVYYRLRGIISLSFINSLKG